MKELSKNEMDTQILEEIGLTRGESKIYLALLELGPSKSGNIIKKTGLQSSVVFNCLKGMVGKGLVNFVLKGKIREYHAVSPNILLSFLDEKRLKLKNLLPKLKRAEKKERQEAEVYYGIKGVKAAHFEQIKDTKKGEEYLFFSLENEYYDEGIKIFFVHFNKYRRNKGLIVKALVKINPKFKKIFDKIFLKEDIKFKKIKQEIPVGMAIFRDMVLQIVWETEEPVAFLLKSKKLAQQYKKFFYSLWNKRKL